MKPSNAKSCALAVLAALLAACAGGESTVNARGTSGAPAASFTGAELVPLDGTELELGDVDDGLLLTREIALENPTQAVVSIDRILRSCGCTETKIDRTSVAPGEHVTASVTIDPRGRAGPLDTTVTLLSKTPYERVVAVLRFRGWVGKSCTFVLEPERVTVRPDDTEQIVTLTVHARLAWRRAFEEPRLLLDEIGVAGVQLTQHATSPAHAPRSDMDARVDELTLQVDRGVLDRLSELRLSVPARAGSRHFAATLLLVRAESHAISFSPPALFFDAIQPGARRTARFVATARDGHSSDLASVRSSHDWVHATIVERSENTCVVEVEVLPSAAGATAASIAVGTGAAAVTLPVHVFAVE